MFLFASTADASQTNEERTSLKSTINFQDIASTGSSTAFRRASHSEPAAGYAACQHAHVLLKSKGNSNPAFLSMCPLLRIYTSVKSKLTFVKVSCVTVSSIACAAVWFGSRVPGAAGDQT